MGTVGNFSYGPPEGEDTCKSRFEFELVQEENGLRIQRLSISGKQGCKGHPQTIAALVKGRRISSLPLEDLDCAACVRKVSCAQQLVRAIRQIKSQ